MKILLIIGAYSFGGAERVICSLANHLFENNEVVLVTLSNREETYYLNPGIKRINGIGWKTELHGIFKLRKFLKQEKPNLIISFITHVNIATIIANLFTGTPIIISERNDPSKSATSNARRVLRKLIYPMASGFVFQTEEAKQYFSNKIQLRSVIIPNPLFLEEKSVDRSERVNEVVSVGRLVPQKRHDLTIKAFASANGKNGSYHLTIYGNGDERENLVRLVSDLNMQDKITINPAVNDLHSRIKNAKIFVLMSEYEGMPNSLMEAMGLGLACISSDCPCGGPRFLINQNCNGILVNNGDSIELCNQLNRLMNNDEEIDRISYEACKIRERLSSEKIFLQWDSFISKIVRERHLFFR